MTCACSHENHDGEAHHRLRRRTVLAGGIAAGIAPLLPRWAGVVAAGASSATVSGEGFQTLSGTRDFGFLPPRPATEIHEQGIMFPVLPDTTLGKATWTDTYLAPRSNGRLHEGQDLMGKKMLKLLACTDGTIVELRYQAAGNSIYLKGTDGYFYCYLHINNDRPGTDDGSNIFANAFAPGMAVGNVVKRGDILAYLGDSGNAEASGSHCHFEIRLPNLNWYNAAACNAKYSLEAAEPAKLRVKVGPEEFAPLSDATAFAIQQANDFLGALPSWIWLAAAKSDLEAGVIGIDAFIERQLANPQIVAVTSPIIRLYQAYLGGIPAFAGVDYWERRVRSGISLDQASAEMAASTRFKQAFDVTTDRRFVAVFFANLYGYMPSAASIDIRINRMANGMTRGAVVRYECESSGYRLATANRTRVITIYHSMIRQAPSQSWLDYWATADRADKTALASLIKAHRIGPIYAARFTT